MFRGHNAYPNSHLTTTQTREPIFEAQST